MIKKGLLILAVVFFIAMPATVFADPSYYFCNVVSTGVGDPDAEYPDGYIMVQLTDTGGSFIEGLFKKAAGDQADRFYAAFLTALSTNKHVLVQLDPNLPDSLSLVLVSHQ